MRNWTERDYNTRTRFVGSSRDLNVHLTPLLPPTTPLPFDDPLSISSGRVVRRPRADRRRSPRRTVTTPVLDFLRLLARFRRVDRTDLPHTDRTGGSLPKNLYGTPVRDLRRTGVVRTLTSRFLK